MGLTRKRRFLLVAIWTIIAPLAIYFSYQYMPVKDVNWLTIFLYFAILMVTMMLPIRLTNITISLERWITFTVFFQYGLFAELIFMQIAMILLLFTGKTSVPAAQRFFINSSMFAVVSVTSALAFYAVGGEVGTVNFLSIVLFGAVYAITYMLTNSLLLKVFFAIVDEKLTLWNRGTLWDYVITILVFPFSVSLYYLHIFFGNKSILICGIPFLFILVIISMYHRSDNFSYKLSSANVIGRELADRLGFEDVVRTFIVKLRNVVSYDAAYVLDLRSGKHLVTLMGSENAVVSKKVNHLTFKSKVEWDDGLDLDIPKIFGTKKEIVQLKNFTFSDRVKSVMTAPIKRNQKTEGMLILTSHHKNIFQALEMKIVDMLTGYFAISLVKARLFEKTVEQSERCGLTNLNNFRYLDKKLDEDIIRYHTGELHSLSAIMLDIDYFKVINDTYGHQSGNDLLRALSEVLLSFVNQDDTLARYGGEEFVFILRDKGKSRTIELAEKIRKEVEEMTFRIVPDLSENRSPIDVQMTISVGVATVPEDAEDAKLLLRNADRALYIGGKQAGRNRVGVFSEKEIVTV
ncbi:GGDEF domain-containing protein [Sporosarcina beigongshangi]|uniref:GGDEF domain-containing protein n=1 Tax=Sporosarcina beigongshangi TaxID=2782538 RepID=UPI00193A073D|nr:diguanylate cyclase [Sporosarcina beigongshangi]